MNRTQKTAEPKPKLWNRNFVLAMLVSFIVAMANGMFNPVLPVYAEGFGIGTDLIGAIVAVATFFSMIARAVVGWLSDSKSKKRLVGISLICMMAAYALYLPAKGLWLIAAARIMQGIGHGALITVLSTLAIEYLPPERMGEGIGMYSLASSLAQCVAPVLGTYFAKLSQYRLAFILALVTIVGAFAALQLIKDAPVSLPVNAEEPVDSAQDGNPVMRFLKKFIYKDALLGAMLLLFMGILHSAISNYLAIYGFKQNLTQIGLFFTVNSVVLILFRPVLGRFADKTHPSFLIIPGLILMGLVFVMLGNLTSPWQIYIGGALYGIGFGAVMSMSQMISVKSAPPEKRGVANGTYYVLGDIGLSLGAYVSGLLAKETGYGGMYLVMAGVTALTIVFYLVFSKKQGISFPQNPTK
ncbi:MFS transporter [Acutalibacter muris]|uniref:MFS transporter n=1 Tax=Acutalibacter muris TaxID=1796620 RepID=A0A1Z2XRJ9_9FIRM|nr:MFS transporter [Acutalibacter muris]ANU55684.1 MFS transporter [Hungateiclostridiaceae bacterium KB18]ASB41073.1 MFS transporter [Acutalibacter muris]QQR30349.1 MFS transporter [Acutalibacter muris]